MKEAKLLIFFMLVACYEKLLCHFLTLQRKNREFVDYLHKFYYLCNRR
jgi:hypothetical protein